MSKVILQILTLILRIDKAEAQRNYDYGLKICFKLCGIFLQSTLNMN